MTETVPKPSGANERIPVLTASASSTRQANIVTAIHKEQNFRHFQCRKCFIREPRQFVLRDSSNGQTKPANLSITRTSDIYCEMTLFLSLSTSTPRKVSTNLFKLRCVDTTPFTQSPATKASCVLTCEGSQTQDEITSGWLVDMALKNMACFLVRG